MRFIRRLIIATAQWVALLSIVVVTFSGGVSGWSWVLGDPNTDDKWGYVGFLAGAFIGFAIAATLAGAYFCLVEIAYNTRQQSEPRWVCNFVAKAASRRNGATLLSSRACLRRSFLRCSRSRNHLGVKLK
jgi:hypothetical protein